MDRKSSDATPPPEGTDGAAQPETADPVEAVPADAEPAAAVPTPADPEADEALEDKTPTDKAEAGGTREGPEIEVFYTFTWAPRGRGRPQGDRPQRKGPPNGAGGAKGGAKRGGKPQGGKGQNYSARPPKKEKAIDPDNPFAAALAGLKKD